LSGVVAAILNDREIVINLGAEAGAMVGMKFRVFDRPAEVRDPNTKEILGTVRREKVRVKVVAVQNKLSIGRTYETYEVHEGGGGFDSLGWARLLKPPRVVTHVRTLRYDDSGLDYGPLEEDKSYVKVGDPVESFEESAEA
jgi:hypothetical protein